MAHPTPAKPADTIKTITETGKPAIRRFNAKAIDSLKNERDFDYREGYAGETWWERFWRWFWGLFPENRVSKGALGIIKWALLLLAIGGLVFFVLRWSNWDLSFLFGRKPGTADIPYNELEDNIHEIDFENAIEKAAAAGNYRLAVRLLYLRSLKTMNDLRIVHWEPGKTNSIYVDEISDPRQKQTFGLLTRQFEYVWYGDFPVNGQRYVSLQSAFNDFKTTLK